MATRAKPVSARAMNHAARHARRDEILERWSTRRLARAFRREALDSTPEKAANLLMTIATEVDPFRVVRASGCSVPELGLLVAALVRVIQLKEMPYDEYLQTDEWLERSSDTKARYGGMYALDAKHVAAHAHHRTYERRGREYESDLIPLCAECHAKHHGRQPK